MQQKKQTDTSIATTPLEEILKSKNHAVLKSVQIAREEANYLKKPSILNMAERTCTDLMNLT
jgi:hypothetical protein